MAQYSLPNVPVSAALKFKTFHDHRKAQNTFCSYYTVMLSKPCWCFGSFMNWVKNSFYAQSLSC